MEHSIHSYLSLGSNLGDRENNLAMAVHKLSERPQINVIKASTVYESEPMGMEDNAPWFLNQVVYIETTLPAMELLSACQEIEKILGRIDKGKNHSRFIDIDILTYGNEIVDEAQLKIPHPRIKQRLFVLYPLSELSPDFKEALHACEDSHTVTPYGPSPA